MTTDLADQPGSGTTHRFNRVAVHGWTFVVLLLVSAAMADVPDRSVATPVARDFYQQHAAVVALAQVISIGAAVALALFARTFARGFAAPRPVVTSGYVVAGAATLTSAPVLVLASVAHTVSDQTLRLLLLACDATDVLLFVSIAGFTLAVAHGTTSPVWRALCAICAVISIARAILLSFGATALGVVAPVAFILLIAALATLSHRPRWGVR
ncbi:MAG TPA: hypothetical protein VM688_04210 [Nocardioidaceae bacterium]|nr:hypothetical protein [Nocardioidaceae bacterium]